MIAGVSEAVMDPAGHGHEHRAINIDPIKLDEVNSITPFQILMLTLLNLAFILSLARYFLIFKFGDL